MEAVPRMPMIWLDLKEAGDFSFQAAVKKFVLKNYGENPEAYNEELKKLELLRQNAIRVPRDFEGCSVLRKYLGQLHYLQSRVPMGSGQEAAVPVSWTEIFSGKSVAHEDIKYEQACILYNLGALHSMLGAVDKRVSEEGMKVSCTHFQCAAGAFAYLREHFPQAYSVDMSRQILTLNVNLMLGQAQECLLEKSMLDNRKSFLVARISAQVVDYYKEACRALENPATASLLGRVQKDWKKLVQMKIYYFAAVAHLHMGKQAEEQQKFGERVAYFQSALDKLNEAIKLAKGQPDTVQDALRFTMDVIGGKYNSAKKDNDFIYHEAVPALDTLQPVKGLKLREVIGEYKGQKGSIPKGLTLSFALGAPLVKPLPVNPTDPAVTGPDIFAKLVPMAAHEASSLYSEEKAKLLREMMAKIEDKNEVLDQFMDSMQLDPETVDNLDMYSHIPPQLMEKCAALSVRPDTVRNLVQSMQVLSGVFTDVEASLKDIRTLLEEDELQEQKLQEAMGQTGAGLATVKAELAEVRKEWTKYMEVHEKASFTNSELHRAMNLHVGNLRLLSGPLDQVRAALPTPALTPEDKAVLQNLKRILAKVQEMRDQRVSLEQQLRELIQKDDITASLVTTDHSEMKKLFEEQLKKYDQLRVYLEQNLAAQDNVLRALTDANVQYAAVRRVLSDLDQKWNSTLQTLVASYEAYEDLMKKSQEGKDFYADLESKVATLLERAQSACQAREAARQQLLDRELKKKPPPRPTAPKPLLSRREENEATETGDLPEELRSLPPDMVAGPRLSDAFLGATPPLHFTPGPFPSPNVPGPHYVPGTLPAGTYSGPSQLLQARASGPPAVPVVPSPVLYPAPTYTPELGLVPRSSPQHGMGSSPYGAVGLPQAAAGLPSAPPPQFPGPELATTVRPATTTVDSVQAPISSHLALRPSPGGTAQPCFPSQPPQPMPYTYPGGTKQPLPAPPAQHPFSPGVPTVFLPPGTSIGLQPHPPRAAFGPLPPQQPLPFQHTHVFPPQAPSVLPSQPPYPYPPRPSVLPQPPTALHTQLYPGPAPEAVQPPAGALPFTSSGPPQPPHPPLAYGPGPSPRPLGTQAATVPMRGPTPAGQLSPSPHLVPSPAPSPGPGPAPPRPPIADPPTCPRRGTAAADLLSSSPESQHGGAQPPGGGQPLLQPTKVDAAEGRRPQALRLIERDPYEHPERLERLQQELEAFRDRLGDAGTLDAVWRELQEAQEQDARGRSIAIARCYSLKNRHQDVMPYDSNRVVLRSGKDDYINASCVEGLSPYCPPLVATQAPLPGTAADFWLMVHEQKVSVIVMLVSEAEMEKQKVARYFPTERSQPMVHGALSVALSSVRATETHVERVLSLQFRDQSLKRSLVHLHFPTWPELGLPDSPGNLLRFIQEVHTHYLHQRPLHTPIVVHCSSGVGRTGAFALLYAAVQEVEAGNGIPALPQLVRRMRQQRKHMLQEKLHLRFCHEAVVRHVEQVLQRHGVPPPCKPLAGVGTGANQKSQLPQDSQDLVLGGDVPISSIQATIAKLSIRPAAGMDSPATMQAGLVESLGLAPASLPEPTPAPSSPPPLSSPVPEAPQPEEHQPAPEPPSAGPPSSSLELLASLTPEAFSLDSSLRGKQRMNKQSFLQAHSGQGLRSARAPDDPLSLLDPLWTLNKT